MQLLIRTKLQEWLSAEDENGNSAWAASTSVMVARAVQAAIDAGCSEELGFWMARTTWNMAVQSKHHLARYTLLAVTAKCLQQQTDGQAALERLNCRIVQLASLLAAETTTRRGSGVNSVSTLRSALFSWFNLDKVLQHTKTSSQWPDRLACHRSWII